MVKRVLMFHYRYGKTDGVSLQMAAWKEILRQNGIEVLVCAGPKSEQADFIVEEFEPLLNPDTYRLYKQAFKLEPEFNETEFRKNFLEMTQILYQQFKKVFTQVQPDRVMVSNVFSVGLHLPAAVALAQVLDETGIQTMAIHHDFYWESVRFHQPACPLVEDCLQTYLPPKRQWLKHFCINTLAQKELWQRKQIEAGLLPDTHNFDLDYRDNEGHCRSVLETAGVIDKDLVVLQATRIVRRKNIELAIDLLKILQDRIQETGKARAVLVMCGYAEKCDLDYQDKLFDYAQEKGVWILHLQEVSARPDPNKCDLYNLYDRADVVTYPSEYEGFGNQFLEAVAARKPIVVFEYPVYKSDIKPQGFEIISLGDKLKQVGGAAGWAKVDNEILARAVGEIIDLVKFPDRKNEMVEKNFRIGRERYGFAAARKILMEALNI